MQNHIILPVLKRSNMLVQCFNVYCMGWFEEMLVCLLGCKVIEFRRRISSLGNIKKFKGLLLIFQMETEQILYKCKLWPYNL